MKSKLTLSFTGVAAVLAIAGPAYAAQLVTNGNFENYALAGAPPGWNTTIGAGGTGQFYPGGPPGFPQAPLSGSVAYMGTGTQMFQTFTTVKLQPATLYTITFDSNISVGFVNEIYPFAYLYAEMAYGVGSGETSSFGGEFINSADLVSGVQNYLAPLTTTAGSYGFAFTTKSIEEGFVGSATEKDIALYFQPSINFGVSAAQLYLDNVSVTATPIPEPAAALLGGLGLLGLLRRRRA